MSLGQVLGRIEKRTERLAGRASCRSRTESADAMLEAVLDAVEAATGRTLKRSDAPTEATMAKRVLRAIVIEREGTGRETPTRSESAMHSYIVLQDRLRSELLGRADTN